MGRSLTFMWMPVVDSAYIDNVGLAYAYVFPHLLVLLHFSFTATLSFYNSFAPIELLHCRCLFVLYWVLIAPSLAPSLLNDESGWNKESRMSGSWKKSDIFETQTHFGSSQANSKFPHLSTVVKITVGSVINHLKIGFQSRDFILLVKPIPTSDEPRCTSKFVLSDRHQTPAPVLKSSATDWVQVRIKIQQSAKCTIPMDLGK